MLLLASRGSASQFHPTFITSMIVSNRALDRIYTIMLAAVVVLSWGYVIYGSWVAARWQLEQAAGSGRHN